MSRKFFLQPFSAGQNFSRCQINFVLLFHFVFLTSFSCEQMQLEDEIELIGYSSLGMSGAAENIQITRDSIVLTYEMRRSGEPPQVFSRKINRGEWNALIQSLASLDWNEIASLESPTNKRAYDGAFHSQLMIRTSQQEYSSQFFDDENPHEKLLPLMKAVRSLANTVDKRD